MWLVFAFVSATIVGIRDFFKKRSLQNRELLIVLCLVTVYSALLFMPFIVVSRFTSWLNGSFFYVPQSTPLLHLCSLVKCVLLIGCWLCSFYGIKHLPLTVSGIIAAFGPVETVLAAMLIYGEHLNWLQWLGVVVSVMSLFILAAHGKTANSDFRCDRYFWIMLLSTFFSTAAALWDKYAVGNPAEGGLGQSVMFIQSWYNIYQAGILLIAVLVVYGRGGKEWVGGSRMVLKFSPVIMAVAVCEVVADLLYDAALQLPGNLVSILAMVRRGSVVVSFLLGVLLLGERDVRNKAIDLALVLLGMLLIFLGS
ncbi:MAG: EamA family transporter [Muribaculaceae bacterium]